MSELSPTLALPLIAPAQAQKHVTHNEALMRLDMLVQPAVADSTLTAPPATPAAGARYLVAPGSTGLWAGHDAEIALYDGVAWLFAAPQAGWRVYDITGAAGLVFDGTAWGPDLPNLQNLDGIGVNATSDAINRLVWHPKPRFLIMWARGISSRSTRARPLIPQACCIRPALAAAPRSALPGQTPFQFAPAPMATAGPPA